MLAQQKERWNKVGLTVSLWCAMISEAGHAVGMQYFMNRTKYCMGFSDKDQICLKIMVFSKKKIFDCNHSQISDFSSQKLLQTNFFHLKSVSSQNHSVLLKKGLHLGSAPDFCNSIPKLWCSLLSKKIKVIMQKFVAHAKHDLQALTACHCCKSV